MLVFEDPCVVKNCCIVSIKKQTPHSLALLRVRPTAKDVCLGVRYVC